VFESQHAVLVGTCTHARRRPDAGVEDNDEKTLGVTVRDIRLAYALEKFFERALAAGGRKYIPNVRSEADWPKMIDELEGYTYSSCIEGALVVDGKRRILQSFLSRHPSHALSSRVGYCL